MKFQPTTLTASMIIAIIATSGLAGASPEENKEKRKDILRGPAVTQTTDSTRDAMRSSDDPMVESHKNRKVRQGNQPKIDLDKPISVREYLGTIRQLRGPQDAPGFDLTDEQRSEIRTIMADLRKGMEEFQIENKEKLTAIRQQIKAAKNNLGDNPTKEQKKHMANVRKQAQEMLENSPPSTQALSKLKAVLSSDQFAMLDTRIRTTRAQRAQSQLQRADRPQRTTRDGESEKKQGRRQINTRKTNGESSRKVKNPGKKLNPDD